MYAIHPIVSQQLIETHARELHRIAGHTRLHRERDPSTALGPPKAVAPRRSTGRR